jgi:hypothetical protein
VPVDAAVGFAGDRGACAIGPGEDLAALALGFAAGGEGGDRFVRLAHHAPERVAEQRRVAGAELGRASARHGNPGEPPILCPVTRHAGKAMPHAPNLKRAMPQNFRAEILRPPTWAVRPGSGKTAAQGVFTGERWRENLLRHAGGGGAHCGVGVSPGDRVDGRVYRLPGSRVVEG